MSNDLKILEKMNQHLKKRCSLNFANEPIKNKDLGCRDNGFYLRNDDRMFTYHGMSDFLAYQMYDKYKIIEGAK
jgi:hypothetical protein